MVYLYRTGEHRPSAGRGLVDMILDYDYNLVLVSTSSLFVGQCSCTEGYLALVIGWHFCLPLNSQAKSFQLDA